MMSERIDVTVVGAGMVGAAAACLLARCGFSVQSCEPSGGANRLWRCSAVIAADTPTEPPNTTR